MFFLLLILVISHHEHFPAVWNSFDMEFLNNNDFVFKYNTTLGS